MIFCADTSLAAWSRISGLTIAMLAMASPGCAEDAGPGVSGSGGGTTSSTSDHASLGTESETVGSTLNVTDSTGDVEPMRICDGSTDLRVVVREGGLNDGGGGGGGIIGLTWLYAQIGFSYLYVRGDCQYWVVPAQAWLRVPAHTGVLDAAQELALASDLGYDRWSAVEGTYEAPSDEVDYLIFSDLSATVRCADRCGYNLVGTEEIRGWSSRAVEIWGELYEQSEPVSASDPLRVDGYYNEILPDEPVPTCLVDWPFSFDPTTAGVLPPPYPKNDDGKTRSRAVSDPSVAEEIRVYWEQYADAYESGEMCSIEWLGGKLEFFAPDNPQQYISIWIRDAVPFENQDGLVPVPIPEQVFPPLSPE